VWLETGFSLDSSCFGWWRGFFDGTENKNARTYDKIHKASLTFKFFTKREWTWSSDNCDMLMSRLTPIDRRLYNFNVHDIIWEDYYPNYFRGTKKYVLKEDMSPDKRQLALDRQARLNRVWYVAVSVVSALIGRLIYLKSPVCRNLWFNLLRVIMNLLRQIRLTIVSWFEVV